MALPLNATEQERADAEQSSPTWLSLQRFEACMAELAPSWQQLCNELKAMQIENKRLAMELSSHKAKSAAPSDHAASSAEGCEEGLPQLSQNGEQHVRLRWADVKRPEPITTLNASETRRPSVRLDDSTVEMRVSLVLEGASGQDQTGPSESDSRPEDNVESEGSTDRSTYTASTPGPCSPQTPRTMLRRRSPQRRWSLQQRMRRFSNKVFATFESGLEFVTALVIITNVIFLGVSTAVQDWVGWHYLSTSFAIFYLTEMWLRLQILGCKQYFCGPSWMWNLFDAFLAVVGMLESFTADRAAPVGSVQILKVLRIGRLVRLVRLLKLGVCKDLSLMISRLSSGLRSLKGAIVLLGFTIWSLAVILSFTVGSDPVDRFAGFHVEREVLCSNVFRAAFTIFRCVTGDCYTTTGQPLAALMMEGYGWMFVLPYVACMMVVTFGILNLIMANFLERTLQAQTFHAPFSRQSSVY